MRIKVVGGVALTAIMLTVDCGEADNADGEDKNASGWCDDLDKIIARGWEYDGGANDGGSVDDLNRIVRGYVREYRGYTEDEMASLNDALEEGHGLPVAATTAKKQPEPGRTRYGTRARAQNERRVIALSDSEPTSMKGRLCCWRVGRLSTQPSASRCLGDV